MSIHENKKYLADLQALMEIRYGIQNPDAFILVCDNVALAFECEDPMYCNVDGNGAKHYGICDSCQIRSDYQNVRGEQPPGVKLNPGHWTTRDPDRTVPLPGMVGFGQVGELDMVAAQNRWKKDREENEIVYCGFCKHEMTLVRSGKHQCDNSKCDLGGQR